MMLGTLAQRGIPPPSAPVWLPAGATAHLDFLNGQYYVGGAERAITTILGGGFDTIAITPGIGMALGYTGSNWPDAIGPLFDALVAGMAAGCSMLFELSDTNKPNGPLISFMDGAHFSYSSTNPMQIDINTGGARILDASQLNAARAGSADILASGVQKISVTFSRSIGGGLYESAFSINGGTVHTDNANYAGIGLAIARIMMFSEEGEYELDGAKMRVFTLYPAMDNTALVALSA